MSGSGGRRPSREQRREPRQVQRRERRGDRGAVIVELALVAPFLIALVLGAMELGSAWRDGQRLSQASRSGARVGSQLTVDESTDREVLLAVEAALGTDLADGVTRIVVYEADGDGDMPVACVSATPGYTGSGDCNVYGPTELAGLATPSLWGSGGACGSADGNWCSVNERDNTLDGATYLGVRVEVERPWITGLFGGGNLSMSEATVMRLEPEIN